MFERFTDRARRVVVLAQEEARDLGHNYIGTEHILLGLIREREGVAARALEALGIALDEVRLKVGEIIGAGAGPPAGHIPFTPRAKKVLELSLREALQLGHDYIGTEHILLGLVREGEGVAAQVLVALGADLNRVRQQVIQLLRSGRPTETASEPGEEAGEATSRTVITQTSMRSQSARSARIVAQAQLDTITTRIDQLAERLDVIVERLASIENLLAGGGRPVPRAPRRPAAPGRPPAARRPKPPAAPPPTDQPPAAEGAAGAPPADEGPADGAPAGEAPPAQAPHDEPPDSGAAQG